MVVLVCGTDEVKQEVVHVHTIQHSWNKSTESTGEQQAGHIPEEAQNKRGDQSVSKGTWSVAVTSLAVHNIKTHEQAELS